MPKTLVQSPAWLNIKNKQINKNKRPHGPSWKSIFRKIVAGQDEFFCPIAPQMRRDLGCPEDCT
jgi:hypothetical protein